MTDHKTDGSHNSPAKTHAFREHFVWPLSIAIIIGGVSILASAYSSFEQTKRTLLSEELRASRTIEAERQRNETQIILNALSAASRDDRIANLEFLARAGLIEDEDGAILAEADRLRRDDNTVAPFFVQKEIGLPQVNLPITNLSVEEMRERGFFEYQGPVRR